MLLEIIQKYLDKYFNNFEIYEDIIYMDVNEEYYDKIHDLFEKHLDSLNFKYEKYFTINYEEFGTFYIDINKYLLNINPLNFYSEFEYNISLLREFIDSHIYDKID